jgi:lipopolysaccharide biosynthesis glycosyltransferase
LIPVFIGYDPREAAAYHVCQESILDNTKENVSFTAVRGERRDGSNNFIYARFQVPHMMGFRGHAIFMDGDMIVRGDIGELWNMQLDHVGVQVVKHDYKTKHPVKYLGNKNDDYPRKNWSSVILWNCGHYANRILFPDFIAQQEGSFLHRFSWLKDEHIGELPSTWNRLVLEQPISTGDKLLHYTIGTPCFAEYADCDGAEEWHSYYQRAIKPYGTP